LEIDDPDSEDGLMGPPAKRLAGVVISDSISEESEESTESVSPLKALEIASKIENAKKLVVTVILSFDMQYEDVFNECFDLSYAWRIDLSKTEPYWSGWFAGLSSAFLSVVPPKLLLLASISGLDRDLTVGQMQGIMNVPFLSLDKQR
jgi:hypothetical protein